MSGEGPTRGDGAPEDADPARTSGRDPLARAGPTLPWERKEPAGEDQVKHSALVGFMSVPVSRRLPIRRSTLLMLVAFIGLATVLYFNPPQSTDSGSGVVIHTPQGDVFVPNATSVSTTSTTTPASTTTTSTRPPVPSPSTTTSGSSGGSSSASSSTTTTGGSGGTGGPGTTTTTTGGAGQTGAPTSSTTR